MYTRQLKPYKSAFFLFGPRGTGKSTWIKQQFSDGYIIDLLVPETALKYQKNPELFRAEVLKQKKTRWIVVDEIQKVPILLDEVHNLIENYGYKKFILTGSSARKLKKGASNLLAGRAITKSIYPLNFSEIDYGTSIDQAIKYGLLPSSVNLKKSELKEDYLNAYVKTYLLEEIKYEGLVRDIGSFSRFLEIATLSAGQVINISGLARDAGIGRDTIQNYFSIFEDTLLGSWLPAYRARAKIKEVKRPKFYWFDTGVLNCAAGAFQQPMPSDWTGILLEHLVYQELCSFMDYNRKKGSLGYWSTPSESEIDFLWWYGQKNIAIEVKAGKKFNSHFLKGIKSFNKSGKLYKSFVVYQGKESLLVDGTHILPVMDFLKALHSGKII